MESHNRNNFTKFGGFSRNLRDHNVFLQRTSIPNLQNRSQQLKNKVVQKQSPESTNDNLEKTINHNVDFKSTHSFESVADNFKKLREQRKSFNSFKSNADNVRKLRVQQSCLNKPIIETKSEQSDKMVSSVDNIRKLREQRSVNKSIGGLKKDSFIDNIKKFREQRILNDTDRSRFFESKPVESKAVESKAVESKPVESKPVESKPVGAKRLIEIRQKQSYNNIINNYKKNIKKQNEPVKSFEEPTLNKEETLPKSNTDESTKEIDLNETNESSNIETVVKNDIERQKRIEKINAIKKARLENRNKSVYEIQKEREKFENKLEIEEFKPVDTFEEKLEFKPVDIVQQKRLERIAQIQSIREFPIEQVSELSENKRSVLGFRKA